MSCIRSLILRAYFLFLFTASKYRFLSKSVIVRLLILRGACAVFMFCEGVYYYVAVKEFSHTVPFLAFKAVLV